MTCDNNEVHGIAFRKMYDGLIRPTNHHLRAHLQTLSFKSGSNIVNGKVKVYQLWESKSVPPLVPLFVSVMH
jgi:hypothetical protein